MIHSTQEKRYRTRVMLVAVALLGTALLAYAPAMAIDPEPVRWIQPDGTEHPNRFVLNVTDDFHQEFAGNWLGSPVGDVVVNLDGSAQPSFWISNRTYEGIKLVLDVTTPSTPSGLLGFALNFRDVPGLETLIIDWSNQSSTLGGFTNEEGLTLYWITTEGLALDAADVIPCFWSKFDCPLRDPNRAGHLEVLDRRTPAIYDPDAPVPPLGWEADTTYRFEILYYNEDISPGSYGILVKITGGTGHYKDGRDSLEWRFTGNEAWAQAYWELLGGVPAKSYFTEPQHLGFYTFNQSGVQFGGPEEVTYTDEQRPKVDVATICSVPEVNGWCPGTQTVSVGVQEDGSGLANVTCSLSTGGGAFYDCHLAAFPVSDEGAILSVKATDHGGKFRNASVNLRIDNTPPILSLSTQCLGSVVNGWCNDDVIVEKNLQAHSGASHFQCEKSLSGGPFQATSCAPVAQDGAYTYRVKGWSNILLESNTETISFLRDATKPTGAFLSPAKGCLNIGATSTGCTGLATVAYGDVPIKVEAADPIANGVAAGMARVDFLDENGVFASIEGDGENGIYETTWQTSRLGEHVIKARLTDLAGNVQVLQLKVDVVIPGL